MATISKVIKEFSDLDLLFDINLFTKDVNRKTNIEAIKASVKNLVLTKNYEKPFHPEIGTQIDNLLFDNYTPAIKSAAERSIRNTIERFEPRVRLIEVAIKEDQDNNSLIVNITFTPKNYDLPVTVQTTLGRLR